MKIKKFEAKHIRLVSNLWLKSFSKNMLSALGKKIIISYLLEFLKHEDNKGFILKKDNQIIAFVLYGNEAKIINKIFIKNLIYILLSVFKFIILADIKKLVLLVNIALFVLIIKIKPPFKQKLKELLIVVVDKKLHGKGYGQRLIKFSLKDYYFRKDNYIFVKTLSNSYQNVKFYKKLKFKYQTKMFDRIFLKLKI